MTQNARKPPELGGAGGFQNHFSHNHCTASAVEQQFQIEDSCRAACEKIGVLYRSTPADGAFHTADLTDDPRGRGDGRIKLFSDGKGGIAQNWKTGEKQAFFADRQASAPPSPADRAAIEAERKRREAERQQTHRTAADKARFIWSRTQAITDTAQHDYLTKKRIKPHGARLSVYGGRHSLVIPIYNAKGQITSLQFIDENGDKRFLPGGEIKGCFFGIGLSSVIADGGRILICEGFATGASLHEWYREPVIVAFNSGNLEPVAKVIRGIYPAANIIVCGDNDESGVGQKAAKAAALACDGKYLLPPIVGQDFNDAINTWRDAAGAEVVV